jgi:integrase
MSISASRDFGAARATITTAAPNRRGKSMTRRCGQSGSVVQKGLMWHGRYYVDVPGQLERIRKSVPLGFVKEMTKSEARRKLRTLLEELGLNSQEQITRAVRPGRTFAEQAEWWSENKLALRSLSYQDSRGINIKKHLIPYFGEMPVSVIGEQEAQEFVTHLSRTLAPATIGGIVSTLKAILGKSAQGWSLILPKAPDNEQRFFTADEMRRIMAAAKGAWKPLFATLSETALRCGECFGLHVDDLDFANRQLFVRRSIYKGKEVPVKSRAALRCVDITPELAEMLRRHLKGRTSGYIFQTRNGTPLSKDNVRRKLQSLLKSLGIPKGGLHSFRHGRISLLQTSGVPGDLIREWVGHADSKITSRYSHFEDAYRRAIVAQISLLQPASMETDLPIGPNGPKLLGTKVENGKLELVAS